MAQVTMLCELAHGSKSFEANRGGETGGNPVGTSVISGVDRDNDTKCPV